MTRSSTHGDRLPAAGAGFVWGSQPSVPILRPVVDGVVAGFTTRRGGVSGPPYDELNLSFRVGDDDELVRRNRALASSAVGLAPSWSVVRQVHGSGVGPAPAPGVVPAADAMWTDDPSRTLAVLGADCVPVLLVTDARLGVAHVGWRGLVAGVIERAVAEVGGRPHLVAGPAIGPCCFAVGDDVARAFEDRFGASVVSDGHVDLWAAAGRVAEKAGAAAFPAARLCTACHPELYFSHRRDRGRTGRMALIAGLAR